MPKVLYPNSFPEYSGGRNCAPETFNPSIYGPQGVYAYGLSLEQTMLLIWRIREWTLFLPNGLGSAQTTNSSTIETDIFCGPPYSVIGSAYYLSPLGSDPFIQSQLSIGYDSPVEKSGELYYPSFSLSYEYEATTDNGNTEIGVMQADSAYVENPEYTFSLSVGNSSLPPITMRAPIYVGTVPLPSLSISEYWSYGGTWNTGDGSPL